MEKVATSLISCAPAGPVETETLLAHTLTTMGLDPDDPSLYVSYFTSDELPPIGLAVWEEDQILAAKRDAGANARFFTVMVTDSPEEDDEDDPEIWPDVTDRA